MRFSALNIILGRLLDHPLPVRAGCLLLLAALSFNAYAGKEKERHDGGSPSATVPLVERGAICPIGSSSGQGAIKSIGIAGGVVRSVDGRLQVFIPEGALPGDTDIGIQAISNTNPAGNGLAYRLMPHGIRFKRPVSITFKYDSKDNQQPVHQIQGIAYQDENGIWQSISNGSVDSVTKRITVYTDHFSDWSQFESMKLSPESVVLGPNETATIRAIQYFDDEDLLTPLGGQRGTEAPIGLPHELPASRIKQWRVAGVGSLQMGKQQVLYKSPRQVESAPATAMVSLELNTRQGQLLLISHIRVINEGITFRIDGGKWIYFTKKESHYLDEPSTVYAEDSMQASVSINWPQKVYSRHPWTTTAEGLSPAFAFHTARNFTNYYSLNTVGEAEEEVASPGYIQFYHFPVSADDYVSGEFLVEKGAKYDARGKKLAEPRIEGYFYVRTKEQDINSRP